MRLREAGRPALAAERTPELATKRMDCQGVWPSGTTYVEFNDVVVPAENLIGEENKGFAVAPAQEPLTGRP